jgi:UDP-4-amino-4,6-dideoxy-N-acetyl-beta-L-altrosamine N-acetyltransferase
MEEHQSWWARASKEVTSRYLIAEKDGEALGFVSFTDIDKQNNSATWAFYSGVLSVRGLGTMMELAALEYAFSELKLNRLECEVLEFNLKVVNFHQKFGFLIEGVKRKAYQREGKYYDIYCLSIMQKDWLKIKDNDQTDIVKIHRVDVDINQEVINSFASLINDFNPIHLNSETAKKYGFEKPISHGMLLGSFFSQIFSSDTFPEGIVYMEQNLKFVSPMLIGTKGVAKAKLQSQIGRVAFYETSIVCDGELVITGTAKVLYPIKSI